MGRGLKRFEVEGFRQFKKPSGINISGLNVIVGPNGSGKSTFTRLMRLMDEVVRKGVTHKIPFSIIDSYGLGIKRGKTFKIRLYYNPDHFFPSDYCIQFQYRVNDSFDWKIEKSRVTVKLGSKYVSFRKGSSEDGFFPVYYQNATKSILSSLIFGKKDDDHDNQTVIRLSDLPNAISNLSSNEEKSKKEFLNSPEKKMLNEICLFLLCENSGISGINIFNKVRKRKRDYGLYSVLLKKGFAPIITEDLIKKIFQFSVEENEVYEKYGIQCPSTEERFVFAWLVKSKSHWGRSLDQYLEASCTQGRIDELTSGILECIIEFAEVESNIHVGSQDPENGIHFTHRMSPTRPDEEGRPQPVLFWKSYDLDNLELYKQGHNQWKELLHSFDSSAEYIGNKNPREKKAEAFLKGTNMSYNVILNNRTLSVDLNVSKNGKNHRLVDLSKGEVRVIALSLLKFYGCNFLEEPENSLHPEYQSKVGARLAEEIGGVNNIWLNSGLRYELPFAVVETHSEYLIRSIQLSVAAHYKKQKNSDKVFLPEGTITDLGEMLCQDTEIEYRLFSELNGITISYFNNEKNGSNERDGSNEKDGGTTIKDMGLREDGMLSESFGPGFFDESVSLTTQLLQLHNNN